ncbi:cytochrome c [Magnetovibrio sp. PR-2]|uniref:c-type cytochrome n=1 Tax=Magnetovibrio sp. PR-2 TaxID=3120356 RepID=UPI002FCE068E
MKNVVLAAALVATTLTGFGAVAPALAEETNPSIVHRKATYSVVGGHLHSLKAILFLGGQGDATYHAESIKVAFEHMGNAYPAGSDKGETKAKAEIWSNMDDFKARGKDSYGATVALIEATKGGDKAAMAGAFKKLAGTCKACHKEYRAK